MTRTLAALMMTVAAFSAAPALAQVGRGPTAVVSPQPLPIDNSRPRVFLGGSIDMGGAPDWQAAMTSALFGGDVKDWVGAGTGSDHAGIGRKIAAIEAGLVRHQGLGAMGVLGALGGREQAAICGAVLAARAARIPVILDGFICTAAASALFAADARLLDHCLVGHCSAEPGHRKLLGALGKKAVLDFDMRLGEGSGAALALGILRSALAVHNGMATFGEAGVSEA